VPVVPSRSSINGIGKHFEQIRVAGKTRYRTRGMCQALPIVELMERAEHGT
jgi:hypothetical protein